MGSENGKQKSDIRDSLVFAQSSLGFEIRGSLVRLTRYLAVFEVYQPTLVLRTSEVLNDFKIVAYNRTIYSGRAVIHNLVDAGVMGICEVTLNENAWMDVEFGSEMTQNGKLQSEFQKFIQEWQKLYKILPEYKVVVADMQNFLSDLKLWLDQIELGIRSSPSADRVRLEQDVADELARPILPCVDELFEKFEQVAENLDEDLRPAHRNHMRRQLHPLVLSAPFAYRSFSKPLGYAGDYETVNMITRNKHEGGSLYAKMVHTWFLRQAPAQAHRNRIDYLLQNLVQETLRVSRAKRSARIFNIACGPALEVQRFIAEQHISNQARLTLLDFNEETLQYSRTTLDEIKSRYSRNTPIEFVKKSVHHLLKESGRTIVQTKEKQYDYVYCAGLFDYLSDNVCHRLMEIMYDRVAPGGLLVATNVEPSNPLRNGMDHLLDWNLNYRRASHIQKLAPGKAGTDYSCVRSDSTGVNVFLEIRKPDHA